jgi:hypothetical protein
LKKTLTASTPNDGLFKWKVPNKFALGSDYSIKVTYLPDTTMWDASEDFSIINSLVGTWNGSWTREEYGATTQVSMILRKDSKVRGSTSQPMAPYGMEGTLTLDLTGAYTYNPDDGSVELIDVVGEGFHAEKETPVRVRLLEASGTVANNTITVDASFVVESIPWPSTEWEEYKSFSDTFVLKR